MDMTHPELPARVEKPWGHEIWWASTDLYVGKILHVKAGHRLSVQYHELKDETSYILRGRVKLFRGDAVDALSETILDEGAQWRNRPGEIHSMEAIEDADVLEVSTPHLDDVVRLSDAYGREGATGH